MWSNSSVGLEKQRGLLAYNYNIHAAVTIVYNSQNAVGGETWDQW